MLGQKLGYTVQLGKKKFDNVAFTISALSLLNSRNICFDKLQIRLLYKSKIKLQWQMSKNF